MEPGQGVGMQDRKTKEWNTVGVVVRAEAKKQCYLVKVDVDVYIWRNRSYLRLLTVGGATEPGELPSTCPPTSSTRGRWGLREKSVTFQLTGTGGAMSTSTALRRSQQKSEVLED